MSGPIVRSAPSKTFSNKWDSVFGDKKVSSSKSSASAKPAKKGATKGKAKSKKKS